MIPAVAGEACCDAHRVGEVVIVTIVPDLRFGWWMVECVCFRLPVR